jgi:hypothetical protein
MFDEEPDRDTHGECAAEIHRLGKEVVALKTEVEKLKREFCEVGCDPCEGFDRIQGLAEISRLKAELAECRNKALEESARLALEHVCEGQREEHECSLDIYETIQALKTEVKP